MQTTLTIMWRKALTPRLIPLCSFYRSQFGANAPQWDLLANDREKRTAETFSNLVRKGVLRRW